MNLKYTSTIGIEFFPFSFFFLFFFHSFNLLRQKLKFQSAGASLWHNDIALATRRCRELLTKKFHFPNITVNTRKGVNTRKMRMAAWSCAADKSIRRTKVQSYGRLRLKPANTRSVKSIRVYVYIPTYIHNYVLRVRIRSAHSTKFVECCEINFHEFLQPLDRLSTYLIKMATEN